MRYASLIFSRHARPEIEWSDMSVDVGGVIAAPLDVGLCGTDFQMLSGARELGTRTLGHEGVVRIVAVGRGCHASELVDTGGLFVVNPVNPASGAIVGHNRPGLFATAVAFSSDDLAHGALLALDGRLDPALGPLIEPLGAAIYALELAKRKVPARTALVVGCGPMGLLLSRLLKVAGSDRVFLADRSRTRLDHALALGLADPADVFLAPDLPRELTKAAGKRGIDAMFFCANRDHGLDGFATTVDALAPGGCVVMTSALPETGALARAANAIRASNLCGNPAPGAYLRHRRINGVIWITGSRGTSAEHLRAAQALLTTHHTAFAPHLASPVAFTDAPAMLDRANWPALRSTGLKHVVRVNHPSFDGQTW